MREKILFDDDWKFHKGDLKKRDTVMKGPDYIGAKTERRILGPASYNYKDESNAFDTKTLSEDLWEDVSLPHDYVIEGVPDKSYPQALGYLKYENAWYRKHFTRSFWNAVSGNTVCRRVPSSLALATVHRTMPSPGPCPRRW